MFHSFQLKGSGLYIAGLASNSQNYSLKMSGGPITERLCLKLQPGHGSSFAEIGAELAAIMKREPGTRGVYWGLYEEDEDAVDGLICEIPFAFMLARDFSQRLLFALGRKCLADDFWCSLG